jgi:hypothetical protein
MLTSEQYTPGRKLKSGDTEYVVAGQPVGEFIPVAMTGDNATGVAGLLPRAALTDGDSQWESVPDDTGATDAPAAVTTVKLRNSDGTTVDVDPTAAETLKTAGWQEA